MINYNKVNKYKIKLKKYKMNLHNGLIRNIKSLKINWKNHKKIEIKSYQKLSKSIKIKINYIIKKSKMYLLKENKI